MNLAVSSLSIRMDTSRHTGDASKRSGHSIVMDVQPQGDDYLELATGEIFCHPDYFRVHGKKGKAVSATLFISKAIAADAAHSAGCSGHEDWVVVFMFRRHVADLGLLQKTNWRRGARAGTLRSTLQSCRRQRASSFVSSLAADRAGRALPHNRHTRAFGRPRL